MNNNEQIIEYEECYLGCLILNAKENKNIETYLQANDFFSQENGLIFSAFFLQQSNGITPDIKTLKQELPSIPPSSITTLNEKISGANIKFYEDAIYEASKKRLFQKVINEATKQIDEQNELETVINNLFFMMSNIIFARNKKKIYSVTELCSIEYPKKKWVIPDLVGEGLTMLCGALKIGKSWFVLNLAIAAAQGGKFLNKFSAQKTDTLYLALEDDNGNREGSNRLDERFKTLKSTDISNLKIVTKRIHNINNIKHYLKNNRIGLVIIDTLAKFVDIKDINDYISTINAMEKLKHIADDLGIAIIVIHHSKKLGRNVPPDWTEAALGSTGLAASADSIIYIDRPDREKRNATFHATGRDITDKKYKLIFDLDNGGWTINEKVSQKKIKNTESENEGTGLDYDWKNMI